MQDSASLPSLRLRSCASACRPADETLAQEEVGSLSHLYAPQGDYSAEQNRLVGKAEQYLSEKGNLYEKQINSFRKTVESGVLDYYYADRAFQVQEIVDKIYSEI